MNNLKFGDLILTLPIIKECKVNILKRMLFLEEKYNEKGYISPFSHYEALLTASNIAFWKIAKRGVITPEDVRTAIYQLEKAGLIEIISRNSIKLLENGRKVAKQIRSMAVSEVPDNLLEGKVEITEESNRIQSNNKLICPHCGKLNMPSSKFCAFCGKKLKKKNEFFCPYCKEKIVGNVKFCPNCGASLD